MGWVRGLMAAYCIILLQVMGYVAAFRKDEENIPVALVITETSVDILFFPFVHKSGERLLTTAHLPLNLWKSGNQIELNCLVLLAYLSDLRDNTITLDMAEDHEKMRKIMKISTDTASDKELIEQMQHKLEHERAVRRVEREKEQEFKQELKREKELRRQVERVEREKEHELKQELKELRLQVEREKESKEQQLEKQRNSRKAKKQRAKDRKRQASSMHT